MSRFPRSEPEIAALALVVTQGLGQASDDFPTPPVAVDELQGRLDAYNAARSAAISAETAAALVGYRSEGFYCCHGVE